MPIGSLFDNEGEVIDNTTLFTVMVVVTKQNVKGVSEHDQRYGANSCRCSATSRFSSPARLLTSVASYLLQTVLQPIRQISAQQIFYSTTPTFFASRSPVRQIFQICLCRVFRQIQGNFFSYVEFALHR
jgi:hypothetical protein